MRAFGQISNSKETSPSLHLPVGPSLIQACTGRDMMRLNLMLQLASAIALALKVRAQDVHYITSAFTQCFPVATGPDILPVDLEQATNPTNAFVSEPNIVTYSIPPCAVCDCPTCTTTSVFTTMLPDFSNGPTERPYIVTETYVGMSSLPHFLTPTPIPFGFTTTVNTCTDCGAQPVTGTIVVPKTGRLWGQDVSESIDAFETHRPGALSEKSGSRLPPEATATFSNVGFIETTLITSREGVSEITQAGDQDLGAGHGGASTSWPFAATPTYIHVNAAESSWSEYLLSYGVVMSAFWVVILLQ